MQQSNEILKLEAGQYGALSMYTMLMNALNEYPGPYSQINNPHRKQFINLLTYKTSSGKEENKQEQTDGKEKKIQ